MGQHDFRNYWRMAMAQARSKMQYRVNFLAQIISMVLTYGGQFVSLYWITQRFETIGGWKLEEIVLLFALAILSWGVCVSFFFSLHSFEDLIRDGSFDRALLRPMNPLLHVLGSQSPIAGMGQFVFSILAFAFAIITAGIHMTPLKWVYLVLTAIGGGMIIGSLIIVIAALAFWTTRTYTFYWSIVFPARQLINYPVSIYHRFLQIVLTAFVPLAFVNYFPAHVFLDRTDQLALPILAWITPLVGIASVAASYALWTFGTRFYTGTGS